MAIIVINITKVVIRRVMTHIYYHAHEEATEINAIDVN